jgi:hypothetical protein
MYFYKSGNLLIFYRIRKIARGDYPGEPEYSRTVNLIGRSYQEQVGSRLDDSTQKFIPVTIL